LFQPSHEQLHAPLVEHQQMIKDVMVRLDGSAADHTRLPAAESIADLYDSTIIGLFINIMPTLVPADVEAAAVGTLTLAEKAREAGDLMEERLEKRLGELGRRVELRRFDAFMEDAPNIATREARSADAFVTLRPSNPGEPDHLVESVLFGSGRHLYLVPEGRRRSKTDFESVLVAWNGSRESTRALAEAMPYIYKAKSVEVALAGEKEPVELDAAMAQEVISHLNHHGVSAELRHVKSRSGDVGTTLIGEARRFNADVIVMGGYGHSRLREWLLGGVTYELLHGSPISLIIAH
jgi:nucleotide-binding universal stress UspA family protein